MSNIDIPSTIVSTVSVHRHADGSTTWTASPQLANTIEMLEVVLAQMQAACGSREGRPCRGWIASDATLINQGVRR